MIIHEVAQGTTEWLELRAGIPTASEFSRILTPTGKPSKSAEPYMHELLAERLLHQPLDTFTSSWMERGTALEDEAAKYYAFQMEVQPAKVGFITTDDGRAGVSPDRLVGDEGLLEIKVPAPGTHVRYLLFKPVDRVYFPQLQGQLWVTGRKWLDILSYCPGLPEAQIRVERDDDYIEKLSGEIARFCETLDATHAELLDRIQEWEPVQSDRSHTDTISAMRSVLRDMA